MFTEILVMRLRVIPEYSRMYRCFRVNRWNFSNGVNDLKYKRLS